MSSRAPSPEFATTCWSEVRRAATLDGDSADALEKLCTQYWYPLYAYLRSAGHNAEAAQDHVQSFFADLLSRDSLRHADPDRGRFRTFLLASCRNHVVNRQRSESSQRRGGGRIPIRWEVERAEQRYLREPEESWTPEKLFDRQWALAVIDAALSRVRSEYESKGRAERFDALRPLVAPDSSSSPSHAEVAETLGCSVGAVKVAAHRLRQHFGEGLRAEIARTIDVDATTADGKRAIEEELGELLTALSGH